MKKLEKIYEGKAKILYATEDPGLIIQYFKDEATAFNAKKKGLIKNKGIMNNRISARIFKYLEQRGVKTHFVESDGEREMVVRRLKIFPIEVVLRNIVAGSLARRMGLEEGTPLRETVLELYYKSDELGDPMINCYHVRAFGMATAEELNRIKETAFRVNDLLREFFRERGLVLVDFKLEFGKTPECEILLADEITPDGCRLWDAATMEKMDKDRFRRDLGGVGEAYEKVLERVMK